MANVSTHGGRLCHYSTNAERSCMKSWPSIREVRISIATSQFGFFSSLYMLLLSQGIWRASHSTLRPCRSSSAATIFPMSSPCLCSFSAIKKSVNFCLNGGSGLPVLQTRKPPDNAVSVLLSRVIQWKLSRFPFT